MCKDKFQHQNKQQLFKHTTMVKYLGTKIKLDISHYPKGYKKEIFKSFESEKETTRFFIPISDVITEDTELKNFDKLIDTVKELTKTKLEDVNCQAFTVIKHVDHSLKGANIYNPNKGTLIVLVEIHYKPNKTKVKKDNTE